MKVIYRGYPQTDADVEYGSWFAQKPTASEQRSDWQNCESSEQQSDWQNRESSEQQGDWPQKALDKRRIRRDSEYLKGLYPTPVRKSQVLVDEWFDRYEHPGSPIYDEYPDREWLIHLRDRIWNQARERGMEPSPEVLYVLLLSEIGRRRIYNLI